MDHIGPIAQDFWASFGTGSNESTLAKMQGSGVAIASIQALNEKLETRNPELEEKMPTWSSACGYSRPQWPNCCQTRPRTEAEFFGGLK